jgi:hypothetical protein
VSEKWMGQTLVAPGVVEKWGKTYAWLQDIDGTHYMIRLDEAGQPVLT